MTRSSFASRGSGGSSTRGGGEPAGPGIGKHTLVEQLEAAAAIGASPGRGTSAGMASGRTPAAAPGGPAAAAVTTKTLAASPGGGVPRLELGQRAAAAPVEGSGGGEPLPTPLAAQMSAAFGTDLSAVRVHRGSPLPASIGTTAVTRGFDIHFAPGAFDPESPRGREVIGHEIAHVVQQSGGRTAAPLQTFGAVLDVDPHLEAEADALGGRAARGEHVMDAGALGGIPAPVLQGLPAEQIVAGRYYLVHYQDGQLTAKLREIADHGYRFVVVGTSEPISVDSPDDLIMEVKRDKRERDGKHGKSGVGAKSGAKPGAKDDRRRKRGHGTMQQGGVPTLCLLHTDDGPEAIVDDDLVDAYLADLRGDRRHHLQEGEGQAIATHIGVQAQVMSHVAGALIQSTFVYGTHGAQGYLLHIGNHYLVLAQAPDDDVDFVDELGNGYVEVMPTTQDGNCLIDGLYIIRDGDHASAEQVGDARDRATDQGALNRDDIRELLAAIIIDMIQGHATAGIGARTRGYILRDPNVAQAMQEHGELEHREDEAQDDEGSDDEHEDTHTDRKRKTHHGEDANDERTIKSTSKVKTEAKHEAKDEFTIKSTSKAKDEAKHEAKDEFTIKSTSKVKTEAKHEAMDERMIKSTSKAKTEAQDERTINSEVDARDDRNDKPRTDKAGPDRKTSGSSQGKKRGHDGEHALETAVTRYMAEVNRLGEPAAKQLPLYHTICELWAQRSEQPVPAASELRTWIATREKQHGDYWGSDTDIESDSDRESSEEEGEDEDQSGWTKKDHELLAELNALIRAAKSSKDIENILTDERFARFVVPQYRGIAYMTNRFSHDKRREHRRTSQVQKPVYSDAARPDSMSREEFYTATHARDGEVERKKREIEDYLVKMRQSGPLVDPGRTVGKKGSGRVFPSRFHAFQSDYSQDYTKSSERIAEYYRRASLVSDSDATEESIDELHAASNEASSEASSEASRDDSSEDSGSESEVPFEDKVYGGIPFRSHPLVSTADDPRHAVRYALGNKPIAAEKDFRLRPRWRRDGKPQHPYSGKVYTSLHPLRDYLSPRAPSSVWMGRAQGSLSIGERISQEGESSFLAGIKRNRVVADQVIRWPSFEEDHDERGGHGVSAKQRQDARDVLATYPPHSEPQKALKSGDLGKQVEAFYSKRVKVRAQRVAGARGQRLVYRQLNGTFSDKPPAYKSPPKTTPWAFPKQEKAQNQRLEDIKSGKISSGYATEGVFPDWPSREFYDGLSDSESDREPDEDHDSSAVRSAARSAPTIPSTQRFLQHAGRTLGETGEALQALASGRDVHLRWAAILAAAHRLVLRAFARIHGAALAGFRRDDLAARHPGPMLAEIFGVAPPHDAQLGHELMAAWLGRRFEAAFAALEHEVSTLVGAWGPGEDDDLDQRDPWFDDDDDDDDDGHDDDPGLGGLLGLGEPGRGEPMIRGEHGASHDQNEPRGPDDGGLVDASSTTMHHPAAEATTMEVEPRQSATSVEHVDPNDEDMSP